RANIYMLMRFMTLIVLMYGACLTYNNVMSIGQLAAFILFVILLFKPIEKICALLEIYAISMAGFIRIKEFFDYYQVIVDHPVAINVPNLKGNIAFDDDTFTYEKTQPAVLKEMSFEISAGETIAFVGPSGAGKTTICSLIPRFYDVNRGQITIDGMDIRDMTMQSLRKHIGIVQQDVFLFTGTLKENIA